MEIESIHVDTADLPWRDSPHPGVRWKKLRHDERPIQILERDS